MPQWSKDKMQVLSWTRPSHPEYKHNLPHETVLHCEQISLWKLYFWEATQVNQVHEERR